MGALSQPLHDRQIKEFTAVQVVHVALLMRACAGHVHVRTSHPRQKQLAPRLDAAGTIKHSRRVAMAEICFPAVQQHYRISLIPVSS